MAGFLAYIVPVDSGAHPEHPIVYPPQQPPLGIWGGANEPFPTPPIVLPKPPSGDHVELPIYYPPVIWPPDAHPEHPIVIPPTQPVYPAHPIVLPPSAGGRPEHPIVIPPGQPVYPSHPIYIPAFPSHPIVLPPEKPPTEPPSGAPPILSLPIELPPPATPPGGSKWLMVYIEGVGWLWILVPVGGGTETEKKAGIFGGKK